MPKWKFLEVVLAVSFIVLVHILAIFKQSEIQRTLVPSRGTSHLGRIFSGLIFETCLSPSGEGDFQGMNMKNRFPGTVRPLVALIATSIFGASAYADNYIGTSAFQGGAAYLGVSSGQPALMSNTANTQIYSNANSGIYLLNSNSTYYDPVNPTVSINAMSPGVTMAVTAGATTINSNLTNIAGVLRTDRIASLGGQSGPALLTGTWDFSNATITGLGGGSFDPANAGALGGVTTLNAGSTYNVDLRTGAAALGAVSLNGATTIVGATNINATGTAATRIGNANATASIVGNEVTATAGNSGLALQSGEARLTVTNAAGNTHGLVVGESSTTLSGGTQSTSLTLNDQGATFGNVSTGAPARVTGVANGSGDFDAVNVRQFGSGVAGAHAVANIPGVDTNKTSSVGVGLGNFMNQQALAFGGSYRFSDKGVLRASLSTGLNSGGNKTAFGVGAGWSW